MKNSILNYMWIIIFLSLQINSKLFSQELKLQKERSKIIVENLLKSFPVIDGHNDLFIHYFDCKDCPKDINDYPLDKVTKGHTDIIRWRKGGVGG